MKGTTQETHTPIFADNLLVAVTVVLVLFSVVMVYSATGILSQEKYGDPLFFAKRQFVAALIGMGLLYVCSKIEVEKLREWSALFLPLTIALLILPLIPGMGDRAGGAQRWVALGPIRFQPGEFAKLTFILFMAGYLDRHEARLSTFVGGIVKPMGLVACVGALFLLQPDFGSTAVIVAVTLCMGAVTGVRLIYMGLGAAAGALALASLVVISPYRMSRIISFLSPMSDVSGRGYQLIQSLIAIGSGRLHGVGLGESKQKLFYLPAAHTDFIFSMVAEELGFVGGCVLLVMFLVFLWRGVRLAMRMAQDSFYFSLAVGLTMLIVLPALLNVGVVTGLLPTKGMVLPLVGYGGSSLMASLAGVGILLALARSYQRAK